MTQTQEFEPPPEDEPVWLVEYDDAADEIPTEQSHPRLFRLLTEPTVFDVVTQTQESSQ